MVVISSVRPRFAELLRHVGDTGIERIFFTSSHPKDLLPETIDAMAEVPAVMPQLHLAVQSGSSRILKLMNRRYTRESYLDLIERVRDRIPDIALSTDIIVGFPGETEEGFRAKPLLLGRDRSLRSGHIRSSTPSALERRQPRLMILRRARLFWSDSIDLFMLSKPRRTSSTSTILPIVWCLHSLRAPRRRTHPS